MSGLTPAQTVGPYFTIALAWPGAAQLLTTAAIRLSGRVLDGEGAPVPDALIEIWQADADGRYHPCGAGEEFVGFGRCATDHDGGYLFQTLKPGVVQAEAGAPQARHINLLVFARGLLTHLHTRVYFPEDEQAHATDAVLSCVPAARRETLIARRDGADYRFDIHLQGVQETVFFEI